MRGIQLLLLVLAVSSLSACNGDPGDEGADLASRKIRIVATTGMVADAVRQVGGDRVEVHALMGPGVDPHLYKAREGDVNRMHRADLIFYNGLHLEGKMGEVFAQMAKRGVETAAVTAGVEESQLLSPPEFEGAHDPHIWFDVALWMKAVSHVVKVLEEKDPAHRETYQENGERFLADLAKIHEYIKEQSARVPEAQRVLITAHDAFNYFGRAYGFEVRGLQGISTSTEAGTADVQDLSRFIAERKIPAIFVESSVPKRSIEAVQAAVRSRGFQVQIGGELFSDSMGDPDTPEGTYAGMVRHNIDTIVKGLLGP